jgi:hypothetical protein
MQPETYTLLHGMVCAASSQREMLIVLRRFKEVFDSAKDSDNEDNQFDAAWAASCMAGLYARLQEPELAEQTYLKSIELFAGLRMALNAATMSKVLATFYSKQERRDNAEAMMKQNLVYVSSYWPAGNYHVRSAEQELKHFQLTGKVIEAVSHQWCEVCNAEGNSVGLDEEDIDRCQ